MIISRGSLYPNVGRVYPSLGYESAALADLCHQLYGISRVILVTTADIYGEDAVAVWNWRAKDYNFHTVGRISLVPGGLSTDATNAALTNAINDIAGMTTNDIMIHTMSSSNTPSNTVSPTLSPLMAAVDGRIWILLSDDIPAIQNFCRVAQSILGQNTYFLGNSVISTPAVFDNVGLSTTFMNVILGGYNGLQHADQDWKVTPAGMDFIKRFQNQIPTMITDNAGKVTSCSKAVDDTGSDSPQVFRFIRTMELSFITFIALHLMSLLVFV